MKCIFPLICYFVLQQDTSLSDQSTCLTLTYLFSDCTNLSSIMPKARSRFARDFTLQTACTKLSVSTQGDLTRHFTQWKGFS